MWLLYNLLTTLLMPIWLPVAFWKSKKRGEQPNWAERFGNYYGVPAKSNRPRLWFHAVSVGEVVAAAPILREIKDALPDHEIVLSVTTSSGHLTARTKLVDTYDHLVYFPFDVPRWQLAAMQRIRPDIVLMMETELWMNFVWAAKSLGAKTALVNGRISNRSFRVARVFRAYYRTLLGYVDECLMQSEIDRQRILELGARDAKVVGNCKFDQAAGGLDADPKAWRYELGLDPERKTVVVGSTRGELEEKFVADALSQLGMDSLNVVYAPRHLERADQAIATLNLKGGHFVKRSHRETGPHVVLDTYGELAEVYVVADAVIIGGGFDNLGGQNLLQPLAHGKPVLFGKHMQNFRDTAAMAVDAGCGRVCDSPESLALGLTEILSNELLARQMGAAASTLIATNLGASRRYAAEVSDLLTRSRRTDS